MRARQQLLLERALPRLTFPLGAANAPKSAFRAGIQELWVEVGAGGGEHALALSAVHPEIGLIACETYVNGLCSLLSRLVPEGADPSVVSRANLLIWPGDARQLLRALPSASLSRLFLLFPDPWPKARHAKRRFVHPAVLPDLARVLAGGAEWRVATDDPVHQTWVEEVMAHQVWFASCPAEPVRPPGWPPTRYEAKALAAGRRPLYWSFRRL